MLISEFVAQCEHGLFPNDEELAQLHCSWTSRMAVGCTLQEYQILCGIAAVVCPLSILEIGPGSGGSSASMLLRAEHARLTQVTKDKGSGRDLLDENDLPRVTTLYLTSQQFFSDNPAQYELIFVDGDHTHDGSAHDINHALKCCQPGGVVLAHDILHPGSEYIDATCRALAAQYGKLYAPIRTNGNGLGIIY